MIDAKRWKPENSCASAYLRKGELLLHGSSITQIGNFNCPPYRLLPCDIPDEQLGSSLLEILAIARTAPPPSDLKAQQQMLFATAKVKSWKQLNTAATNCCIFMTPADITVIPTRNEGRGFMHLPERNVKLPANCLPKDLGTALREGFSRCLKD